MLALWIRCIGWMILALSATAFCYFVWCALPKFGVREVIRRERAMTMRGRHLLCALACVFGIGVGLKLGMIGPPWVRFYLSDFGLPAALAETIWRKYLTTFAANYRASYIARSGHEHHVHHSIVRMFCQIVLLAICFGLAVAYERLTADLGDLPRYGLSTLFGRFDWVDVACYAGGFVLGTLILLANCWECWRYIGRQLDKRWQP